MSLKLRGLPISFPAYRMSCALMLAALCAACGMNLRPAPLNNAASLNGTWHIPKETRDAAVEQLRTALKAAADAQDKRERKRGDGTPPGHENWEMREQREQREALTNFSVPPQSFTIAQRSGQFEITTEGGARRSFSAGDTSTLVTTFGSFYIESGWENDEFVVHSRNAPDRIDLIERYQRQANALLATVTLTANGMKAQTILLTYTGT